MLYDIINLCGNIFELYIIVSFFSKFSNLRVSKPVFGLLCCLFTALQFASNTLFLTKSYLVMFGMVLFIFLVSLLYKGTILSRIFSSIFLYILFALSEFIIAMSITSLADIDIKDTQNNIFLFAICTLISKFLTWFAVKVLKFNNKKQRNWLPFSLAYKTIPLPLATFFTLVLLFICCNKIEELKFRIIALIVSLMLTSANIFVFYIIDNQNDYIRTKESLNFARTHIQNQINHYAELYSYQNNLSTYKHDAKNRLLALLGLLEEQQTDKALALLKHELSFLDNNNNKIINSGNPVVDAVIQSKSNIAKKSGITISATIRLTQPIKIDGFELGVLIGNALDNAIEATSKFDYDSRNPILISLLSAGNHLSLLVKNSVLSDVDTSRLNSTKSDKENHGYGINSVKTIAKKYDGEVFISCESNIFELRICLINTQK